MKLTERCSGRRFDSAHLHHKEIDEQLRKPLEWFKAVLQRQNEEIARWNYRQRLFEIL